MPSVLVIGDVMTDIVVRPDGALALGADRRAVIRTLPGGSGANQAAWLASEGIATRFVARVGESDAGHQAALLEAHGVQPALAVDPELPTGALVTLLSPDGERSFLTDRAANLNLARSDLPDALLEGVDFIHVSGYALFEPGPRDAVLDFLTAARRRDIAWSVDPSSWSFLREVGARQFFAWTASAAISFPNEDEAACLAGTEDLDAQLERLTRIWPLVVLSRGAAGAVAADANGDRRSVAAPSANIVDTTGAGDAFLAGFLSARLRGADIEASLRRGIELGSRAVTALGGRPPGGVAL